MTKQEFLDKVKDTDNKTHLVQAIELENGDKEIQVTPWSLKKIDYIKTMYDSDMRHTRNNQIRIVDVMVV